MSTDENFLNIPMVEFVWFGVLFDLVTNLGINMSVENAFDFEVLKKKIRSEQEKDQRKFKETLQLTLRNLTPEQQEAYDIKCNEKARRCGALTRTASIRQLPPSPPDIFQI